MNNDAWYDLPLPKLLSQLNGRVTARKARLIACACIREAGAITSGSSSEAVALAERFADGKATSHQLASARFGGRFQPGHSAWPACWSPDVDDFAMMHRALVWATGLIGFTNITGYHLAEKRLAAVVRDLVGNPLRPRPIDPAWLVWNDGTLRKIAESVYDERSFDQLPILGDALEEAGCADPVILGHCRQADRHHHGCWLLDTILAKS